MALFLGLQKCYAPVWNQGTKSKNLPLLVQCPQRAPSHFKNAVCTKYAKKNSTFSTSLTLSFWLFWPCSLSYRNVAHIFGIGRQSLKNYLFKLSVLRGLLHTFLMWYAKKWQKNSFFSTSLTLSFWLFWPCSLSYRNVTHTFGIGGLNLKSYYFKLSVFRGLLHTFKMRFSRNMAKNCPFFIFGTP